MVVSDKYLITLPNRTRPVAVKNLGGGLCTVIDSLMIRWWLNFSKS